MFLLKIFVIVKWKFVESFLSNNTQNNLGSGGGWHRDSIHKEYKAIVYLKDVDENSGNLQIIKKSNNYNSLLNAHHLLKKDLLDTRFTNSEVSKIIEEQNKE